MKLPKKSKRQRQVYLQTMHYMHIIVIFSAYKTAPLTGKSMLMRFVLCTKPIRFYEIVHILD